MSRIIEPPKAAKREEPEEIEEELVPVAPADTAEEVQPADQAVELSGKEDGTLENEADEGNREAK